MVGCGAKKRGKAQESRGKTDMIYRYDVARPGVWYYPPLEWTVAGSDRIIRPFGGVVVILQEINDETD
jgi:hypothetical protein